VLEEAVKGEWGFGWEAPGCPDGQERGPTRGLTDALEEDCEGGVGVGWEALLNRIWAC